MGEHQKCEHGWSEAKSKPLHMMELQRWADRQIGSLPRVRILVYYEESTKNTPHRRLQNII